MRAFDFEVRALAPRRSHSISRWTRFSSACCSLACARRNSRPLFEELAVVAGGGKESEGIGAIDFGDARGAVFEEVAVVGYEDGGEGSRRDEFLEPENAFDVEVVGGFVEKQHVGFFGEGDGDGQALPPSARQGAGFGGGIVEAHARNDFRDLDFGFVALVRGGGDYFAHGSVGVEAGILLDHGEAHAFAGGDGAVVGRHVAAEDAEEGGLPCPVGSDDAEALAVVEAEGDIREYGARAKGFADGIAG